MEMFFAESQPRPVTVINPPRDVFFFPMQRIVNGAERGRTDCRQLHSFRNRRIVPEHADESLHDWLEQHCRPRPDWMHSHDSRRSNSTAAQTGNGFNSPPSEYHRPPILY